MGSTLTAVLIGGGKGLLVHVGDSRLYLLRDRIPHQLSTDHTLAAVLRRSRMFRAEDVDPKRFEHVLTRSVGTHESVEVDSLVFDVMPGDRLLLCSDGLTDMVKDPSVLAESLGGDDFDGVPDELVRLALSGGGADNVTALVVRVDAEEAQRPVEVRLATDVSMRLDALRAIFLFEDLPLAATARVLNACRLVALARGDTLQHHGAESSSITIVVEGRLSRLEPGVERRDLGPGDHLGDTTRRHSPPDRGVLVATKPSNVLVREREGFLKLVRGRPELGVALLERLATHLSRVAACSGSAQGTAHCSGSAQS